MTSLTVNAKVYGKCKSNFEIYDNDFENKNYLPGHK